MAQDKILTLLGFCKKAGKLVAGTEKVTELIKKGVTCLVMLSSDISPKTEKELLVEKRKLEKKEIRAKKKTMKIENGKMVSKSRSFDESNKAEE